MTKRTPTAARAIKLMLLLTFFYCKLFAAYVPAYDSTDDLSHHSFSQSQMQEWRSDGSFRYERKVTASFSLWERIRERIYRFFMDVLSTKQGRRGFWTIVFILSAALIAYFIIRYNAKMNNMFLRKNEQRINFGEVTEDIHSMDFPAQIASALQDDNFRLAIRLQYLSLLKFLTDRALIDWRAGKTNDEYVHEIAKQNHLPLYRIFGKASYVFDSVWYGETEVSKDDYNDFAELVQTAENESKYVNKKETAVA